VFSTGFSKAALIQFSAAFLFLLSTHAFATGPNAPTFCSEKLQADATFEDLQKKIVDCKIEKIEDLLPLLSDSHLSHYVLLHHSLSLQGANATSPRAILYGAQAKLILAFNGDPAQIRYNHLEVIQFRDSTQQFEMRDLTFPEGPEGKAQPLQISDANPPLCLSCHRNDPRPNWATYPLWPGAFGGEDDSIFRKDNSSHATADFDSYISFVNSAKKTGRYQYLSSAPQPELPNTDFGSSAHSLNLKRIARRIKDNPVFAAYRYALMGALTCYYSDGFGDIQNYIPTAIRSSFTKSISDLDQETALLNRNGFTARIQNLQKIYPNAPETSRVQELFENIDSNGGDTASVSDHAVATLRWIIENNGDSTSDWSMIFQPQTFDFENGYYGIQDFKKPLSAALLSSADDQILAAQINSTGPEDSSLNSVCKTLQERSLQALSAH
jgi:hypothetical protein